MRHQSQTPLIASGRAAVMTIEGEAVICDGRCEACERSVDLFEQMSPLLPAVRAPRRKNRHDAGWDKKLLQEACSFHRRAALEGAPKECSPRQL